MIAAKAFFRSAGTRLSSASGAVDAAREVAGIWSRGKSAGAAALVGATGVEGATAGLQIQLRSSSNARGVSWASSTATSQARAGSSARPQQGSRALLKVWESPSRARPEGELARGTATVRVAGRGPWRPVCPLFPVCRSRARTSPCVTLALWRRPTRDARRGRPPAPTGHSRGPRPLAPEWNSLSSA